MANSQRGEITVELDGREWTLCLTLAALAELEQHFDVSDLAALAERLSSGQFGANDLLAIIHAGLRGGGHDLSLAEVGEMRSDNGGLGYAAIVAELLIASFGAHEQNSVQEA